MNTELDGSLSYSSLETRNLSLPVIGMVVTPEGKEYNTCEIEWMYLQQNYHHLCSCLEKDAGVEYQCGVLFLGLLATEKMGETVLFYRQLILRSYKRENALRSRPVRKQTQLILARRSRGAASTEPHPRAQATSCGRLEKIQEANRAEIAQNKLARLTDSSGNCISLSFCFPWT